ncbi:basic salivary proline-rich protein 2-like [Enhydra lutris kenyoni]|uniref:Basic salivary proline-rich protein 2-like n=1 Tax=Enhydra lutris kenyoni TaxID=391180 RepID=A0A2Y9J346_ENHLU|nr:basic salivary proline-rich protein 2-like [Enhydra lutris kenyoni]
MTHSHSQANIRSHIPPLTVQLSPPTTGTKTEAQRSQRTIPPPATVLSIAPLHACTVPAGPQAANPSGHSRPWKEALPVGSERPLSPARWTHSRPSLAKSVTDPARKPAGAQAARDPAPLRSKEKGCRGVQRAAPGLWEGGSDSQSPDKPEGRALEPRVGARGPHGNALGSAGSSRGSLLSTFSSPLQGAYFTGIKQGSRKHTAFRARPPPPPDLPHRPGSAAQGPWERRRPPGHPGHSPTPHPGPAQSPGPQRSRGARNPEVGSGEQNFADSAPCRPERPRAPSPHEARAKPGFAERCCILGMSPVLRPQLEAPPPR